MIAIELSSGFLFSPKLGSQELWESNLKHRFERMNPDEAHKKLHEELKKCDDEFGIIHKKSSTNSDTEIDSCYCLEKYLDAVESISAFNTTGYISRNAIEYMADTPQCWVYMKEQIECRLYDIATNEVKSTCLQYFVLHDSNVEKRIITSPFFGSERLKLPIEIFHHLRSNSEEN